MDRTDAKNILTRDLHSSLNSTNSTVSLAFASVDPTTVIKYTLRSYWLNMSACGLRIFVTFSSLSSKSKILDERGTHQVTGQLIYVNKGFTKSVEVIGQYHATERKKNL